MPAHFEDGGKCGGSKILAGVHTILAQFQHSRKFDANNFFAISPQNLMPKKCGYILQIDLSRFESVEKCSIFIVFECSHDAVFKMCWSEFRFQNAPFSKNVAFLCEREASLSHFSPFSKCAGIV